MDVLDAALPRVRRVSILLLIRRMLMLPAQGQQLFTLTSAAEARCLSELKAYFDSMYFAN